jgi:hypothetical protein
MGNRRPLRRGGKYPGGYASVGRPQNGPDLGMLEHVLPQPVVMTGAHPCESPIAEGHVTVSVQAGGDTQGVRRQVTLEHVVAGDVKDIVSRRCHVEAAVAERVEIPVTTFVVLRHPLRDAVNDRLEL